MIDKVFFASLAVALLMALGLVAVIIMPVTPISVQVSPGTCVVDEDGNRLYPGYHIGWMPKASLCEEGVYYINPDLYKPDSCRKTTTFGASGIGFGISHSQSVLDIAGCLKNLPLQGI